MTDYARSVLEDARFAVDELQGEHEGRQFRVRWRCAMAHLRAVLHTLKHTDHPKSDPQLARAIDELWSELKSNPPAIFSEVIDRERNLVLKEGRVSASKHSSVPVEIAVEVDTAFSITSVPEGSRHGPSPGGDAQEQAGTEDLKPETVEQTPKQPQPPTTSYDFKGGSFDGQDSRILARQALEWVEDYLDAVDARANRYRSK